MWILTRIVNETEVCAVNLKHFYKITKNPDNKNHSDLWLDQGRKITIETHLDAISTFVGKHQ